MFTGFPEETVRFFLDIRFHNEISYYQAHEDEYRQFVKDPFFSFIEAMAPTMAKIAGDMELRPGKCLARLRRDTRFTKDKTPFRDHLWLLFRRAGESRDESVMYWFELSPEDMAWGIGFWGENRAAMDVLRKGMVQKPSHFLSVLEECRLTETGLALSGDCFQRMRIPEQVPEPLIPYYPRKSLYIKRDGVPMAMAYSPKLVATVSKDFLQLKPMYLFLRAAADEGRAQLDKSKKGIL